MKILFENRSGRQFLITTIAIATVLCVYVTVKTMSAINQNDSLQSSSITGVAVDSTKVDTATNTTTVTTTDTASTGVPDFNQFDKLPNSPLWESGHKLFTDNGKYWQIDVEVKGNQVIVNTMPGMNNTSHPNKKEVISTETGTIVNNTIISLTPSGSKIKNAFRYLNGNFYTANNEGQYNEYKEIITGETEKSLDSRTTDDKGGVNNPTVENSPLWNGSKNFCDGKGLWYITVSVSVSEFSVATFAGAINKIKDKEHPTDIDNAEIVDNVFYKFISGGRIKNGYKYTDGVFYVRNSKGQYDAFTECK